MLSAEENELATRIGPGTLMGNLMRQYWAPALLSSELPEPDCTPVRVLLLGEKLIAFRDSNGQVGLLENNCPHRGASLWFGRNEDRGLRCVYHGWKFDVSGRCIDMPNEPPESNFKDKVRARAYPCQERGGIVWTYMGPRTTPPPLPDLEANMLPEEDCAVQAIQRECNWLQGLEGEIDTSHLGFLHFGGLQPQQVQPRTFQYYSVLHRAPKFHVVDTDYGAMYGAQRPAHDGLDYWRLAHFLFPFHAMIPVGVLGREVVARSWVPMDDTHLMFFSMTSKQGFNGFVKRAEAAGGVGGVRAPMLPNTTDWYGRFRLAANHDNEYMLDRAKQQAGDFSGIPGIHVQDQAITESLGPILDRRGEHLGASDSMVIRVRRRLLAAARALADHGEAPPGVDNPQVYRIRSGGAFLPEGADWVEATHELRQAFVDHPELDPAISGGS
jgi:phthalate 4,5-dioxygenase